MQKYMNQAIPSPYGVLLYETAIEQSALLSIIMDQMLSQTVNTDMTPYFIGKRVTSYSKLIEFTKSLYF